MVSSRKFQQQKKRKNIPSNKNLPYHPEAKGNLSWNSTPRVLFSPGITVPLFLKRVAQVDQFVRETWIFLRISGICDVMVFCLDGDFCKLKKIT